MADQTPLITAARDVLAQNNHKNLYTFPAEGVYPHQWLWDSCFIAIGLRHHDVERAQQELKSLLRGQWSNGMLPHIIFDSSLLFRQDRNIWRSHLSPYSPEEVYTTGLTQPPMLAEAVVQVGKKLTKGERRSWYRTMLPALVAYHEWLYSERDLRGNGLVAQLHPYETGLDSTPPWIDQLHKHHFPWWAKALQSAGLLRAISLVRRDTQHIPPGQRMNNLEALLYYDVLRSVRGKQYNARKVLKHSQFVLQDLTFNCIFIRANECLVEMAELANSPLPQELNENIQKTRDNLDILWDSFSNQYYSRNVATNTLVREPSIAALMPLYAGSISKERAQQLVDMLDDTKQYNLPFPAPSVPKNSTYFEPQRYWQGPTWVNTNWLIIQGLERYGFDKEAKDLRRKTLDLVQTSGCYEYFSPLDGSPAGAKNFSWTAALTVDLLHQK